MSGRNQGDHGDDGGADGPRLRPYADMRWIEDRAAAFTDNVNNRVPGQTVSIGQLELGSNVEIPIAVRTGEMTFTGGLGLVWSNTEGDYIPSESGGRGRGEIGFSYDLDDNSADRVLKASMTESEPPAMKAMVCPSAQR